MKTRFVVRDPSGRAVCRTAWRLVAWWAWYSRRNMGYTLDAAGGPPLTPGQAWLAKVAVLLSGVASLVATVAIGIWLVRVLVQRWNSHTPVHSFRELSDRNVEFMFNGGGMELFFVMAVVMVVVLVVSKRRARADQ